MSAVRRADGLHSSPLGINSTDSFDEKKMSESVDHLCSVLTFVLDVFAFRGCCLLSINPVRDAHGRVVFSFKCK